MSPEPAPISGRSKSLLRIVLINGISCAVVATVILGGFVLIHGMPRVRPASLPKPVIPDHGDSMWRYDDRLGFALVPAAKGYHKVFNFQVTYTVDEQGRRITPNPENPVGRVLVLGCSFTFGDGVQDTEPFPYVLGREYWTRYKISNRSSMAYGTGQAYLITEEEIARPIPPDLVLYGYISGHVQRNYLDKHWLEVLEGSKQAPQQRRGSPHFEIENGRVVFKGVVGPEAGLPPGPELDRKSIEITIALIEGMDRICKDKGVPFLLAVLPINGDDPLDAKVLPPVTEHGVNVIDLRHLCTSNQFIPNDGHPAPPCHARIAEAIANAEATRRVFPRR